MKKLHLAAFYILLATFFILPLGTHAAVDDITAPASAKALYKRLDDAVFQIRIIDTLANEKNVIGSGFRVSEQNHFITNYHVVSTAASNPDAYTIEYMTEDGRTGKLVLLAIDVINDLALLKAAQPATDIQAAKPFYLHLAQDDLQKGDHVFSMGNPHDLGMTIIEGVYNGFLEKTFFDKILFSGALNPGMSGGPAFNAKGEVIGVNVAIHSDDIGYLVPVRFVKALIHDYLQEDHTEEKYPISKQSWEESIETQLYKTQDEIFTKILHEEWGTQKFGAFQIPKATSSAIKCWSTNHSENDEQHHSHNWIRCRNEGGIYISSDYYTGQMGYNIEQVSTKRLSRTAFAEFYSNRVFGEPNLYDSYRNEKSSQGFTCKRDFITLAAKQFIAAFCTRGQTKFKSLYDTYSSIALLNSNKDGYRIEIGLEAVSKENAIRFHEKFLKHVDLVTLQQKPALTLEVMR